MPNYPGPFQTGMLLYQNRQGIFWDNETPAAGAASRAFQLGHCKGNGRQGMMSVDVLFSSAPGAYEIDVEIADFDQDNAYVSAAQLSPGNSQLNAGFATRITLNNVGGNFIRVRNVANPNGLAFTAFVNRS